MPGLQRHIFMCTNELDESASRPSRRSARDRCERCVVYSKESQMIFSKRLRWISGAPDGKAFSREKMIHTEKPAWLMSASRCDGG